MARACGPARARCVATLALIALMVMVTASNRARDEALGWERHTYDVMLLTRNDRRHHRPLRGGARPLRARRGARRPAPLITTNGAAPAARSASSQRQVRDDPGPARAASTSCARLFERRGARARARPPAPPQRGEGTGGLASLYQAGALADRCRRCAPSSTRSPRAERANLDAPDGGDAGPGRPAPTPIPTGSAGSAMLIGLGAVGLGLARLPRVQRAASQARREADSEAGRALELERGGAASAPAS